MPNGTWQPDTGAAVTILARLLLGGTLDEPILGPGTL
jgi:hypothetical protein